MVAVTSKEKHTVIWKFEKLCKVHGHVRLPINRATELWAVDALIQSYTLPVVMEVMEYYFEISSSPDWKKFVYKFSDLLRAKKAREEDSVHRARLRQKMKELIDES